MNIEIITTTTTTKKGFKQLWSYRTKILSSVDQRRSTDLRQQPTENKNLSTPQIVSPLLPFDTCKSKIQSGVGQKALEFTYKLSDLALLQDEVPDKNPESKSTSGPAGFACVVEVKTLRAEKHELFAYDLCVEGNARGHVGQ